MTEKYLSLFELKVGKDKAWFCDANLWNSIFEFDFKNGETRFLAKLPEEGSDNFIVGGGIAKYQNKIVVSPRNGNNIYVFDTSKNSFDKISVQGIYRPESDVFTTVEVYKNYAYIFPLNTDCILRVDLNTFEYIKVLSWLDVAGMSPADYRKKHTPWFRDIVRKGDECELKFWDGDKKLIFDMNNESFTLVDNNSLKSLMDKIGLKDNNQSEMWFDYTFENKICFIPRTGEYLVSYDIHNESIQKHGLFKLANDKDAIERIVKTTSNITAKLQINNYIYFFSNYDGELCRYDVNTDELVRWPVMISQDDVNEIYKKAFSVHPIYEQKNYCLENFIKTLCSDQ